MSGISSRWLLVAVSVMVMVLFVGAAIAGAEPSSPVQKSDAAVSPESVVVGPVGVTPVVYVATGSDFPDALGAGPVAGITDGPILLVSKTAIPVETQTELNRLNPDRIVIVGGTGVVSAAVETALGAYAATVERLSGANRYATAAAISKASFPAAHQYLEYDTSIYTTTIGASCTRYEDAVLSFAVSGPGTVIVEANVNLWVNHVPQATISQFDVWIGTSATDCIADNGWGGDHVFHIMSQEPAGDYAPWVTLKRIMHFDAPARLTFYITGRQFEGTDTGSFNLSFMDATFIPDPGT